MESTEMIRNGVRLSDNQKDELTATIPPPEPSKRFQYLGEMLLAVGISIAVIVMMTAAVAFTWLITTSLYHRFVTASP